MQKRVGRNCDPGPNQKFRRTKGRVQKADTVREGLGLPLAYVRLSLLWLAVISLDVLAGFRFELLWPFWLVLRAGYESFNKNQNSIATLANQNSAKFSVFFVCVTATSDLICYLFIPIPWLIFLASTYVWVSLIWATHGGFLRTVAVVGVERSQALPILLLGFFVINFEYFCRKRCDFLPYGSEGGIVATYLGLSYGCDHVQGITPGVPRNLNSFFGAHCIGYPLVLISFSLRYYFREWVVRRQRVAISYQNEAYIRLLTEALPAHYDGPKDYTIKTPPTEDEFGELLEVGGGGSTAAMILPPPSAIGTSSNGAMTSSLIQQHVSQQSNGHTKRTSVKQSNGNGVRHRGGGGAVGGSRGGGGKGASSSSQHSTPLQQHRKTSTSGSATALSLALDERRATDAAYDDSDGSDEWHGGNSTMSTRDGGGGVWWLRVTGEVIRWIFAKLIVGGGGSVLALANGTSGRDTGGGRLMDDDDDSNLGADDVKKSLRNGDTAASKSLATPSSSRGGGGGVTGPSPVTRKGRTRDKAAATSSKEKNTTGGTAAVDRHKSSNGSCVPGVSSNGGKDGGESSRDTSVSQASHANNNNTAGISMMSSSLELERLRTEIVHVRAAEQDAQLQVSVLRNGETLAKQQAGQLKENLDRMEHRYATLEKLRDVDRTTLSQLEKKYAELLNRKNDVERELMMERKARKEDGGKRSDTVEQYRERERLLERDIDRLRTEAACREERAQAQDTELDQLRKYRENNENDVAERSCEMRQLRERIAALEEALQSENKLKQDLFRALGDARTHNAHLEAKLCSSHDALSVSVHHPHHSSAAPGGPPMSPMMMQQHNGGGPCIPQQQPSPVPSLGSANGPVCQAQAPEKASPTPLPPTYNMAMQQAKQEQQQQHHMGNFLYTALHHSSPTGEHLLFDQAPPLPSSCSISPHDPLLTARMGKYGAPANPARIN